MLRNYDQPNNAPIPAPYAKGESILTLTFQDDGDKLLGIEVERVEVLGAQDRKAYGVYLLMKPREHIIAVHPRYCWPDNEASRGEIKRMWGRLTEVEFSK